MSRQHTADCYANGCRTGTHPAPRPGHVTGGPWKPEEVVAGRSPDAPTDRAGDGHRQAAVEVMTASIQAGDRWADLADRIAAALAAAEQRGRDETARKVEELAEDLESYVAARGRPERGTYDDGLNRAQAAIAADLRALADRSEAAT